MIDCAQNFKLGLRNLKSHCVYAFFRCLIVMRKRMNENENANV